MSSPDVLLSCRGLQKSYGGVRAVTDVSFEVRVGEIVGLVGPNGAGKTTVVDLIVGTQPADRGEVRLRGRRLSGPPSRRSRHGLARTFQHPQLAHELTVRENLVVGAAAERMSTTPRMLVAMASGLLSGGIGAAQEARLREAAETVGVTGLDRLCADLPLGEQRLVEVARALLRRPAVLLLDEPFAGSDSRGAEGVMAVVRQLAAQGRGVLVVDHNVDIMARLVDRVVLMDRGRVLFDGDPAECMASPQMREVYFGAGEETDTGDG